MKLLITIIGLSLVFSSCNHVYFIEPQPKGGERQSEIPKHLYGTWFGETEGWQINENGFTYIDIKTDSVGNIIDTTYQTIFLSDSLRLYKAKELYVIHARENIKYWEIIILKPMNNGDVNTYYTSDPKVFSSAKGLKLEKANFYIDGELQSVKTLDPLHEESLSFESAVFSGQMKIKILRKIINKISPTIFKNDGSIFNPEETIQDSNIENE